MTVVYSPPKQTPLVAEKAARRHALPGYLSALAALPVAHREAVEAYTRALSAEAAAYRVLARGGGQS